MLVSLTWTSSQLLYHHACMLSSLETRSQESSPASSKAKGKQPWASREPHSKGLMSPSGQQWLLEQLQSTSETEMKNDDRILLLQKYKSNIEQLTKKKTFFQKVLLQIASLLHLKTGLHVNKWAFALQKFSHLNCYFLHHLLCSLILGCTFNLCHLLGLFR